MQPHSELMPQAAEVRGNKTEATKAIVWSIAGSDSGGGAGIQADLLTMRAFGVHGCSLITAITAQSSVAVARVELVSEQMLAAQWQTLLADLPPVAIKIGLVASRAQQQQLTTLLATLPTTIPVIIDPVLIASCGDTLTLDSGLDALPELPELYRFASLLTPNLPELAALTGLAVTTPEQIITATECLLKKGVRAVLVKGGHASGCKQLALDYLASTRQQYWLASPRIDTEHNHGTGCSLASAIASGLALGYPLDDAVVLAKAYLNRGLSAAYATGQGAGTLSHLPLPVAAEHFPLWLNTAQVQALYQGATLADLQPSSAAFSPLAQAEMGLYPVVDSVAWLKRLLPLGINTIQLRIKTAHQQLLSAEIAAAIALGKQYQAQVFINDHWQLALQLGAYGVHLGQEDLATADLAALQQAGIRLGVSSHGFAELLRAKALQPSYIALGHIFPTKTKQMPSQPQGVARLAQYVPLVAPYPTVAIGGINAERLAAVAATGVKSIAVVTAITEAADPEQATLLLMACLAQAKSGMQAQQVMPASALTVSKAPADVKDEVDAYV
ncbi:thiamine monophosphate synthase [Alishewanella agri BL06]|uniref:Thiamine-phosphate synthase n=1 Tax=Alishewanella agri BL06 TaxID=1195246 RepID=I9P6P1_9ALTE|nr:thiamine phosphate synthase [Alishewanella agri]EIW90574.1 thiamine monophosphate synthase [Alishewanella agri BL06]